MKLIKRLVGKRDVDEEDPRDRKARELAERQRDGEQRMRMIEAQARVTRRQ